MEILVILFVVVVIAFIFKFNGNRNNDLPLKEIVKKTFPKYKIIEKHGTVMICEISHRNEPEELVFIRINTSQRKNIRKSGKMLIVDYTYKPTAKEMKIDLKGHL